MRTPPILGLLIWLASTAAHAQATIGQPLPACPALEGQLAHPSHKVTVIDFWASWCPPCRKLMPYLDTLYTELASAGLLVVAVNVDEAHDDAARMLRKIKVNYPVVFDPAGQCAAAFALQGMPATFVVDASGVVRYSHAGFRASDRAALRTAIDELLNNPQALSP